MNLLYCARCNTPLMNAATVHICPTCGAVYRQHGTHFFLRRQSVRRIRQRADAKHGGHTMNDNDRFYPVVQTPVGKVLLIGATMTVERERELFGKKVKTDERAGTHN